MRKFTHLLSCFCLAIGLMVFTTAITLAWPEDPPDKVTISGPGLKGEVEVTDQEILAVLSLGAIEDFEHGSIPAPNVGEGYQITRYFYDASFDFGRLRYYPNSTGERGYIFFEDGPDLVGDHSRYNGKWFYATPQGDEAMRRLLAELGVLTAPSVTENSLPPLETEAKVTVAVNDELSPLPITENPQWFLVGIIALAVCALAGGAMVLRR
jgi:hypothetical protein